MPADAVYNLRLLSIIGIDDFLSIVFTNVAREKACLSSPWFRMRRPSRP